MTKPRTRLDPARNRTTNAAQTNRCKAHVPAMVHTKDTAMLGTID